MTKANLVDKIATKAGMTKVNAERALNIFLESIQESLVTDQKLTLVGFGTFSVEERQARQGRNPRTGDPINIPASKVVKFKPGKVLKESVN